MAIVLQSSSLFTLTLACAQNRAYMQDQLTIILVKAAAAAKTPMLHEQAHALGDMLEDCRPALSSRAPRQLLRAVDTRRARPEQADWHPRSRSLAHCRHLLTCRYRVNVWTTSVHERHSACR